MGDVENMELAEVAREVVRIVRQYYEDPDARLCFVGKQGRQYLFEAAGPKIRGAPRWRVYRRTPSFSPLVQSWSVELLG